jgi:formylglycine-generating enzyme required for sulfatase activity
MALDLSLSAAQTEVVQRFWEFVDGTTAAGVGGVRQALATPLFSHLVRHPDDGKLMTLVAAGFSPLGDPAVPVWTPGFYIDVFPTTCADYARFLEATGHRAPHYWGGDRPPEDLVDHPVVAITLDDMLAYAGWADTRLPTAAQWEKAARGPQGWTFPWGDEPTPMRSNVKEQRHHTTTAVDWFESGTSPYGVFDLCGNVWEWVQHESGWQARGGSFTSPYRTTKASAWTEFSSNTARDDLGFRTTLSLPAMLDLLAI